MTLHPPATVRAIGTGRRTTYVYACPTHRTSWSHPVERWVQQVCDTHNAQFHQPLGVTK